MKISLVQTLALLSRVLFTLAFISIGVFTLNVLYGAPVIGGKGSGFIDDVSEMLVLILTTVFFVAGVLTKEAQSKIQQQAQ